MQTTVSSVRATARPEDPNVVVEKIAAVRASDEQVVLSHSGASCIRSALWRFILAPILALAIMPAVLSAETADGRVYRLSAGDRITVTVFGETALSGDYVIEDGGTINVPLTDPIEVKDLTVVECQQRISERLAEGVLRKPAVSVRIAELRPLYVLGDVRLPGAYPFRFGSTVQSAVALAGGFGPGEAVRNTAVSDFLVAEEHVRQLTSTQRAMLVRKARLEAQRDGKESFQLPPGLGSGPDNKDVATIVANEMDQFTTQKAILDKQIETIRSLKPHMLEEIQAYTEQANAGKKQLEIIRQQIEKYEKIFRQGLGTQNNDFQYRVLEANQEATVWRSLSEVSHLQIQLQELDVKIRDAEATFRRQVATELQQTLDRLEELKVTVPAAIRLRDIKRQYAGGAADNRHSVAITRRRDGHSTILTGDDLTAVEPGDVIEIKNELPHILPHDQVATAGPTPWRVKTDAAQTVPGNTASQ